MASTLTKMSMYAVTLKPPSAITQAILGQFAGTKEQQILTVSGTRLTLYRTDATTKKMVTILSHDCFATVRTIAAFKLAGSPKDNIIVGSDSGRITILEYVPSQNRFKRLHLETFGKSGVRRVVPGQYLAVDAKGRACMMASVEKNKLVYVLNRNAQTELTISSPLEAHKPQTLVFALTALDMGYDNPIFAALEIDYSESEQDPTGKAYDEIEKHLVYYELDLGLNHVVRKWSEPVDRSSHILFQVPGGTDGPGGVLVCSENSITYRHFNQQTRRVPIPRRRGAMEDPDRKRHIISGVMHRMRGAFFFLLQTEDGDLFKATLDVREDEEGASIGEVDALKIKYFDTVPVATSLLILKSGFLFVASESENYHLYQFEKLGDDDDEIEFSSTDFDEDARSAAVYFHARPAENIALVESTETMNPTMECRALNLLADEDAPQIYSICGTGCRSAFKMLKHGIQVNDMGGEKLPVPPTAVWAIKKRRDEEFPSLIIISFLNQTLVLKVDQIIEEVSDTGIIQNIPTMAIQQMGHDTIAQVHSRGIHLCTSDGAFKAKWESPQHRTVVSATTNEAQIVVALSSGEIAYFEMDDDDNLQELEDRPQMTGTVTCLSLGDVPPGRRRSSFLAVGCDDSTVRILSTEPDSRLESKSVQALTSAPSALNIIPMTDSSSGAMLLNLHIGLWSGVYLRTILDEVTGELSDTRTRFLGPKQVKIFKVRSGGENAVLALSTNAWLGYSDPETSTFMLTPLNQLPLEWGDHFSSSDIAEGIVGIQGDLLKIVVPEDLSSNILQESVRLAYTPRHFVKNPDHPLFYVACSDNNTLSSATRTRLQDKPNVVNGDSKLLPPEEFGYPRGRGHWASCIQVVDPINEKSVLSTIDLDEDHCATSIAVVSFSSQDNEAFLVVGVGIDIIVSPRSHKGGQIRIYRFHNDGRELEFIHSTAVEEPPLALIGFQGRLLVGVGPYLRLYDLGMKQLLRKCNGSITENMIVTLQTQGSRIIVGDSQESVTYVAYKVQDNVFVPFADDVVARHTTCCTMVDYDTVAGGDKFGNLWMLRCPRTTSEEADEDNSGAHMLHERRYLQGTPNRIQLVAHYYPQDVPTSIQKVALVAGGRDVLLWSGLQGTIGLLIPFVSREDVEFFQQLEVQMRTEEPPLVGRDHLLYRGYYVPVKSVIDGDLCERYLRLPVDGKARIAGELDRSVREVERKIADIRTRVAY